MSGLWPHPSCVSLPMVSWPRGPPSAASGGRLGWGHPVGELENRLRVATVQAAVASRPASPACPSRGHGEPGWGGVGAGRLQNQAAGLCLGERRGRCSLVGSALRTEPAPPSRCLTFKAPSPSVSGPHCVVTAVGTESAGREAAARGPGAGRRVWTEQAVWAGLPVTAGPHACHSPEHAHAPDIGCRWRSGGPWRQGQAPAARGPGQRASAVLLSLHGQPAACAPIRAYF